MKQMYQILASTLIISSLSSSIYATNLSLPYEQQEAARADASLRQRADAPMAGAALSRPKSEDDLSDSSLVRTLPTEVVSFQIDNIIVNSSEPVFNKYKTKLSGFEHQKIGMEGISFLQKHLQEQLLSDGYITSQVIIPNQDLKSGTLIFEIMPGYVEDIVSINSKARFNWRSAFPVRPGNILRRQALEQGIDQINSVPGQEIKLSIEPGNKPLHSIVKLTVKQKGFVHGSLMLDNAGYKSTGQYQGTTYLSFSQLIGLNDTLTTSFTKGLDNNNGQDSQQYAFSYTIPNGNQTYRLSTYKYKYEQLVFMPNAFISSGTTRGTELSVEHLLNRTSRSKTSAVAKISHKSRHSYLEDVEIGVQEQHTSSFELGLSHRQYSGNTVSDIYLFYRQGIKGFGAKVQNWEGIANNPTTLYKMAGIEGQIQSKIKIGHKQGLYTMRFRSQFTDKRLFGSDQFSIGGRYSVRGFSGEETLRGDSGYYIQNEWSLPLKKQSIIPYIGVDLGHVWGPSTEYQIGNTLIGGVLGVRGNIKDTFNYDISLGTPIKKPTGFTTDTRVWAFKLGYQF